MEDRERLARSVDAWWTGIGDVTALLDDLPAGAWQLPTDLPGWTVHDVAAHLAHLESVLAGAPQPEVTLDPVPAHARGPFGLFTEQGVVARRDRSPQDLVAELRRSAQTRRAALDADPPSDGSARHTQVAPGLDWDLRTLLSNRVVDVWMHEQDVRRAVGRPGNLDSPAGRHTVRQFTGALGYVVGKRAGAAPGSTVVVEIDGSDPIAIGVDPTGRAGRLPEVPTDPTARLHLDPEAFVVLAGGRRAPQQVEVEATGDAELVQRLLAALAVTP